jgi:hypothetical protein
MTTSPPAGRNPVRQQLDELDALLQRMLALPVNRLDGTPAEAEPRTPPAPRTFEQPPHAPTTPSLQDGWKQPAMMLLTDSGPVQPPSTPEPPRWDPSWGINLNPQNGSSILGARSPAASPPRAPEPTPAPAPPTWRSETVGYSLPETPADPPRSDPPAGSVVAVDIPEPEFRPRMTPRPEPPPLFAIPFVALDQLFDTIVSLVPLGSLFSTRIGKHCVGAAGIVMLIGGVSWGVLDFFGWTR